MEGKRIKVFGVIMSLLLVFSFAATFSLSSTSVVSAGTQKWTQISIPGTDDMQLAPGTQLGDIAVSPDGGTLFAAVYVYNSALLPTSYATVGWYVVKSVDDGYTWKQTGLTAAYLAGLAVPDATDIVDIRISPDWVDDGVVVVATQQDAYYSSDRGGEFESMGATGIGTISSLDVSLDDNGIATYMVGTSTDVYILQGFSGWNPQLIFDPTTGNYVNSLDGVLDVAFSPNYDEDGVVYAVITGTDNTNPLGPVQGTILRAESDIGVNNWGAFIMDGFFVDKVTDTRIIADYACMGFADDYNSQPVVFVGLTAWQTPGDNTTEQRGDAFRVDIVTGAMGTSNVYDLDVRPDNRTNIMSIAVSGDANSAFILVGLRHLSNTGAMESWQGTAHYSSNGGESWLQVMKPPAGMKMLPIPQESAAVVLMAPDFEESGVAYCANGYLSGAMLSFTGFYASITQGTTFNGRGLLGQTIDEIYDVQPSPDYDSDSTLFMVTKYGSMGLLWESKNGGSEWELILGMTLMIPLPGLAIDTVGVPSTYPTEPSVFVNGPTGCTGDNSGFVRSTDEGNLFATAIKGPYLDGVAEVIDAWKVIDKDTIIAASGSNLWLTTDMGAHWTRSGGADTTNDIDGAENVVDMQLWNDTTVLVGTDDGNVYMCQNWETDFSFTQVDSGPGINGDEARVAFDTNYDDNGMIYAGVNGAEQGVWRIDANGGDDWEQIYAAEDILSIACDGNGILWAIADGGVAFWPAALPLYQTAAIRQVNPTAPIDDILPGGESPFEYAVNGLTSDLWLDLETAPTQTYVFAIGGAGNLELWAYIDTLIKPTLISPADGATAAGTILQGNAMALLSIRWEEMPKATTYEYQVAYDTGFGSIAVEDDTVEGTQATIQLFLGEQYYWRVRAVAPIVSQWSEVWTFTTPLGPASSKPVVTYPGSQDSHNDIPLTPTLTWTSTVECTGYELMVAKNCDWSSPIVNLTGSSALGTDTCYSITQALDQDTNYCWKVRAVNEDTGTASPWSDTGTFTTLVIEEEEEEGTPVWVWVVIALSAVLLVGVVVLIIRTRRPV